jgi:hypothetical protein
MLYLDHGGMVRQYGSEWDGITLCLCVCMCVHVHMHVRVRVRVCVCVCLYWEFSSSWTLSHVNMCFERLVVVGEIIS